GGIATGIAACVRAIALRYGALRREPARECEVSSWTCRRRGFLSGRSLGRNRDDCRAVDPSRANGTLRTPRAGSTSGTTRPGRTLLTNRTALADLAPVTGLLWFDFTHRARLLGNAERASQRSRPMR